MRTRAAPAARIQASRFQRDVRIKNFYSSLHKARVVSFDTGVIPRTSATVAKVLGNYGYKTAAFGKWHNTPATQTTAMGPFTLWPTGEGIGFDYFYGFLGRRDLAVGAASGGEFQHHRAAAR